MTNEVDRNIDVLSTIFSQEGNCQISYFVDDNSQLWIKATDLAEPLGKTVSAIRKSIVELPDEMIIRKKRLTSGGSQEVIFLSLEGALMEIIQTRCKKKSPLYKFKLWAVTKLRQLLIEGQTSLYEQETNNINELYNQIHQGPYMIHNASIIENTLEALEIQRVRPNEEIPQSIENRLIHNFKIMDTRLIRSYSISLGRLIRKKYKRKYNQNPLLRKKSINNSLKQLVSVYESYDYKEWIDTVIQNFIDDQ